MGYGCKEVELSLHSIVDSYVADSTGYRSQGRTQLLSGLGHVFKVALCPAVLWQRKARLRFLCLRFIIVVKLAVRHKRCDLATKFSYRDIASYHISARF